MDRRLIVPTAGGIGLIYCAYMLLQTMLDEGWTLWGIVALAVMTAAAIAAFVIAWQRNKQVKAEWKEFQEKREQENQQE